MVPEGNNEFRVADFEVPASEVEERDVELDYSRGSAVLVLEDLKFFLFWYTDFLPAYAHGVEL